MGGKSRAPDPPDPQETSAAQTGTNVATAIANAFLQNPNQTTPYGSLTHTFDDANGYTWTDPYTGQSYTIPQISAVQEYTDEGQQVVDNQVQADINLSGLAADQSGFLRDYLGAEPFSYDPGQHENWALGLYDQLSSDRNSRQEEDLRTRLANQGITSGSEAFNREMDQLYGSRDNSRNQFMLDSYGQGMQTALTNRNQPINEIIGLLSGSQVQQPNFVNANVGGIPTTDNAGLINQHYNQEYGAWQQDYENRQGLLGGMFGLGANLIGGGVF